MRGCKSAGAYDEDTGRYECQVTGDDCYYLFPNSKACAEDFGEGPDADAEEAEKGASEND